MFRKFLVVCLFFFQLSISAMTAEASKVTAFEDMFGDTLYKWSNSSRTEILELRTSDLLKGKKTVAIYYSASW